MGKRRLRAHVLDLWPDMSIKVMKEPRMGVRDSVSRDDFGRLGTVRRALQKVCFDEIVIVRKDSVEDVAGPSVDDVLKRLDDEQLFGEMMSNMKNLDRKQRESLYLMILTILGKELLI